MGKCREYVLLEGIYSPITIPCFRKGKAFNVSTDLKVAALQRDCSHQGKCIDLGSKQKQRDQRNNLGRNSEDQS